MPVRRIYVPVGRSELTELADAGRVTAAPGAPREAFAVTDALVARAPGLDEEDLEYAAFTDAVQAASAMRAAAGDRRVVVAADADPDWVVDGPAPPASRVSLVSAVPVSRVASFHIDELPGAALRAPGTDHPSSAADEADELLWYDVTELDEVRSLLG